MKILCFQYAQNCVYVLCDFWYLSIHIQKCGLKWDTDTDALCFGEPVANIANEMCVTVVVLMYVFFFLSVLILLFYIWHLSLSL